MPSPQGLTKAGQAEIGSEDQLLGTVWVPGLCLQLLPAPGSPSGELGVPPSEEGVGEEGDPLPYTLHSSPEYPEQPQGTGHNSMGAGSR